MAPKRKSSTPNAGNDSESSGSSKSRRGVAQPEISQHYTEDSFLTRLKECFQKPEELIHTTGAAVHTYPFTCSVIPKFIGNEEFLENLKDELQNLRFNHKNNDLYKFKQTKDLGKVKSPHVAALTSFLYKEVLEWMKTVTGIPLTPDVHLTASRYEYTDALLCHDDELEGRRIAFMLYLVPPWNEKDGGALDLFDVDDNGQPKDIVKSLLPKWNNFTFFEVSPKSFHQVAEILSQDKSRLSVNGWFYGPPFDRPSPYSEPLLPMEPPLSSETGDLAKWINPMYLKFENQLQIRSKFEEDSEIELTNFLQDFVFNQLEPEFKEKSVKWEMIGPPNKRHYEVAIEEELSENLRGCLDFFRSEEFFLFVSTLTGLCLHPLAEVDDDDENDDDDNNGGGDDDDDENGNDDNNENGENDVVDNNHQGGSGSSSGSSGGNNSNSEDGGCGNSSSNDATTSRHHSKEVNSAASTSEVKEERIKPDGSTATGYVTLRRWKRGSYTLVYDQEDNYGLDVHLFFNSSGWTKDMGGFLSYIAKDEDEELLTVCPSANSLALVYADCKTKGFVKYVNSQVEELNSDAQFHSLTGFYIE